MAHSQAEGKEEIKRKRGKVFGKVKEKIGNGDVSAYFIVYFFPKIIFSLKLGFCLTFWRVIFPYPIASATWARTREALP